MVTSDGKGGVIDYEMNGKWENPFDDSKAGTRY